MSGGGSFICQICTCSQRPRKLFVRHGRFVKHVACALAYLAVQQSRYVLKIPVDSHIDDMQLDTMQACKNTDRRASCEKVEHHLLSYGAWIGTDAFRRDSVIRSEDIDSLAQGRNRMST